MRKFCLCILVCLFSIVSYAQYSGYVGETIYLPAPAISIRADWSVENDGAPVAITDNGLSGASVVIMSYFSGSLNVICQYAYRGYKDILIEREYYSITCKPATSIINERNITLKPGESRTLTASCSTGFSFEWVLWKTSDRKVAEVDDYISSTGKSVTVKAKYPGECDIVCYANTGPDNPVCHVVVKSDPPQSISLSPDALVMREGEEKLIRYKLSPENTFADVTWSSSDDGVATISYDGRVKAISSGKTTITATTDNGLSATAMVEVAPVPTGISIEGPKQIPAGYSIALIPQLTPSNALASIEWVSDDLRIVTVDGYGMCQGKQPGTATVTAITDNGKTAQYRLTVVPPPDGMDKKNVKKRSAVLKKLVTESVKKIK